MLSYDDNLYYRRTFEEIPDALDWPPFAYQWLGRWLLKSTNYDEVDYWLGYKLRLNKETFEVWLLKDITDVKQMAKR